jgi:hypothetical protein
MGLRAGFILPKEGQWSTMKARNRIFLDTGVFFVFLHKLSYIMKLIIDIDSAKQGKELANFLRSVKYVKSVKFEDSNTVLSDEEWCLPGRPATNKEMKELADKMEMEEGGTDSMDFFNKLRKDLFT